MAKARRHLDLQAKVSLVLAAVIVPTFLIVTIAENKFTQPILREEIREVGITSGKELAAEIVSGRLLSVANPTPAIEDRLQELLYIQPNIVRIDVAVPDQKPPLAASPGSGKVIASNIEEDPGTPAPVFPISDTISSDYRLDESGVGLWDISVPIEQKGRDPHGHKRLLGVVHVVISMKLVGRIIGTLWKTTVTAAGFSVVALILALSYFLRKTIANDRLLRQAESQNIQLTEKLHDTQRQLMNTEKLAVMGQLTASFAHEIGTPLTAIGGHLQLLKEELGGNASPLERVEVIDGQVTKIEQIVKSFLQSTSKPTSQRQLVDVNQLVDKTLEVLRPVMQAAGIEANRQLDRAIGPIRVVPLEIEQVLLNLLNNSIDSLKSKSERKERTRLILEVSTEQKDVRGRPGVQVSVYDTGDGIEKTNLKNVLKPFFTTKPPGEGTGLGLTICQQLAHKYGGTLEIDSKEGAWTRVTLVIPFDPRV